MARHFTMSDLITDLLTRFPNCRVHINSGPIRARPKAGDVKIVRGKRMVRRQVRYQGMYCVRNGRPVFEWVKEDAS